MKRFLVLTTCSLAMACGGRQRVPHSPSSGPDPAAFAEFEDKQEAAMGAIDDLFAEAADATPGAEGQTFPLPSLTLGRPGDRAEFMRNAITMVCDPIQLAQVFESYTNALELFDEAESEKVGNWIHWIEAGAIAASGVLTAVGIKKDNSDYSTAGAAFAGGAGVLEFLKSTGIFKSKIVNEVLVRVEFNRQFGILMRQYSPTLKKGGELCTGLVDFSKGLPGGAAGDATLTTAIVASLVEAFAQLTAIHDAAIKVGAAAETALSEGKKKNVLLSSDKIAGDLDNIATLSKRVGADWAVHQAVIQRVVDCIRYCEPPP